MDRQYRPGHPRCCRLRATAPHLGFGKAADRRIVRPSFRGDPERWNPEELLVASLSACHQLWYLGLCAQAGVIVESYVDRPEGIMVEEASGAGQFDNVTLRPHIIISPGSDAQAAIALHAKAHDMCFIARSVNFPVHITPTVTESSPQG